MNSSSSVVNISNNLIAFVAHNNINLPFKRKFHRINNNDNEVTSFVSPHVIPFPK
jgi:hypothetical protein